MGPKHFKREKVDKTKIRYRNKISAVLVEKKICEEENRNKQSKFTFTLNKKCVEPLNKDFIYFHTTVEGKTILLLFNLKVILKDVF